MDIIDQEVFFGLVKVFLFLAVLAPLIFYVTRWYGSRQNQFTSIHLKENLPLGTHRSLYVVEWEGERLLLGVTPQQINMLDKKPISFSAKEEESE